MSIKGAVINTAVYTDKDAALADAELDRKDWHGVAVTVRTHLRNIKVDGIKIPTWIVVVREKL